MAHKSKKASLGFLLMALQGQEIVVELKSDAEIRGIVEEGDWGLNVVLRDVTSTSPEGVQLRFESLLVAGRSVRFIHIPPHLNMRALVSAYEKRTNKIRKSSLPHKIKEKK